MNTFDAAISRAAESLEHVALLNARYRAGEVHAYVPEALKDSQLSIEKLIEQHLAASHLALEGASRSLFFSLPVAFNPAGTQLVTGCHDGNVRIWDVAKGQQLRQITAHTVPMKIRQRSDKQQDEDNDR